MRFADLFSGIGGFRLALEALGHKCVFSCEIDRWARETYKLNFNVNHLFAGDIAKVRRVPEGIELITAGFPCQDFSMVGPRLGFDGLRGSLFWELTRVIDMVKPRYFLLENVPGLTLGKMKPVFAEIMKTLRGLGYTVEVVTVNSDFCLPQNRKRLYFVGARGDCDLGEKLLEIELSTFRPCDKTVGDIMDAEVEERYYYGDDKLAKLKLFTEKNITRGNGFHSNYTPIGEDRKTPTLLSTYSRLGSQLFLIKQKTGKTGTFRNGKVITPNDKTLALQALNSTNVRSASCFVIRVGDLSDRNTQGYRVYSDKGKSVTQASAGGGVGAKTGLYYTTGEERVRRLTCRECGRLMGFPDTFQYEVSDTQAYKQFGNAVCPPVIKHIAEIIFS